MTSGGSDYRAAFRLGEKEAAVEHSLGKVLQKFQSEKQKLCSGIDPDLSLLRFFVRVKPGGKQQQKGNVRTRHHHHHYHQRVSSALRKLQQQVEVPVLYA